MSILQDIRLRKWPLERVSELISPPVEIDFYDDAVSAEFFIEEGLSVSAAALDGSMVVEYPQKVLSYLSDSLFLLSKAESASRAALNTRRSGMNSWSLVDVHHASLLYGKAVCGFFGIHILSIKGKSLIIDFFPEYGNKDQMNKFRKEHSSVSSPVRILNFNKGKMSQREIWSVLDRVMKICSFDDDRNSYFQSLLSANLGSHKPIRHKILYGLRAWPFPDDLLYVTSNCEFSHSLAWGGTIRHDVEDITDTLLKEVRVLNELRSIALSMLHDLEQKLFVTEKSAGTISRAIKDCFCCR